MQQVTSEGGLRVNPDLYNQDPVIENLMELISKIGRTSLENEHTKENNHETISSLNQCLLILPYLITAEKKPPFIEKIESIFSDSLLNELTEICSIKKEAESQKLSVSDLKIKIFS